MIGVPDVTSCVNVWPVGLVVIILTGSVTSSLSGVISLKSVVYKFSKFNSPIWLGYNIWVSGRIVWFVSLNSISA